MEIKDDFQITDNYALAAGGGIGVAWEGGSITMTGGEICRNHIGGDEIIGWGASSTNCGVGITGAYYNFTMTGGTIKDNITDVGTENKRSIDVLNACHANSTGKWKFLVGGDAVIGSDETGGIGLWFENDYEKTFLISEALSHRARIYIAANSRLEKGKTVVQADGGYTIQPSDLTHISLSSNNLFLFLDSGDNKIKIVDIHTNGGVFLDSSAFGQAKLPTPTKDGNIFDGWYTDPNFTESSKVAENATISTNNTYYAKWVGMNDVELQYGGEQRITASNDLTQLSDYQSDNPSVATVDASGNVTATGVGIATISATGIYNGQQATFKATVTVTPRVITYTLAGGDTGSGSITYRYSGGHHPLSNSLIFQWKDSPNTKVNLVEGTDINYTYTVPKTDETPDGGEEQTYAYLPMPVGTYNNVKFNLLNENYTFGLSDGIDTRDYLEIDIKVVDPNAKPAYLASAWPKDDHNFVYDGTGKLPVEGTLNAYEANSTSSDSVDIGAFTINIEGLNDTIFHSEVSGINAGTDLAKISNLKLPTEPGTYIITASAEGNGYYLYKSLVFTISKAKVTVKADDQLVYVGDAMPQFTYTAFGLVGTDTLKGTVSFDCEAVDTDKAGTYAIAPSGAEVPDTDLYDSDIEYQSGTLTIQKGSSGGASHPEAGGSTSSSFDRYQIEKPSDVENGSIQVSDSKAEKGDTVTITVTPDEGYELDKLAVYDKDGDEIDLTDKGNGKYTFEIPKGDVEIEVSFAAIKDETVKADFADVASDAWYADAVQYVYENGMMSGTSETTFSPDLTTTRGMIVTILYRLENEPAVTSATAFTDVAADQYYANAVAWAAQNGIVSGIDATTFAPNAAITREQMAAILYRYAQFKGYDVSAKADLSVYTDAANVGAYAADAMAWANGAQLITGTSEATLTPAGQATRAQVATILMRFCENIAK